MAESDLSNQVDATTVLPAASGVSASTSGGDVDVSWTNNDDSPDGGIDVERRKRYIDDGIALQYPLDSVGDGTAEELIAGDDASVSGSEQISGVGGTNGAEFVESEQDTIELGEPPALSDDALEPECTFVISLYVDGGGIWFARGSSSSNDNIALQADNDLSIRYIDSSDYDVDFFVDGEQTTTLPSQEWVTVAVRFTNLQLADATGSGARLGFFRSGKPDSFYFDGRMDEFYVYHRALSDSEIKYLSDNPAVRPSYATVATGLSPSTDSYTDSSVAKATTYEYRIERNTDHATATSAASNTVTTPAILTRSTTITANSSVASSRTGISKSRNTAIRTDSQILTARGVSKSRTPTVTGDSAVSVSRAGFSKQRGTTVTGDSQINTARILVKQRATELNADSQITTARGLSKTRDSVITANGAVSVSRTGIAKVRDTTVTGDSQITTTRDLVKERTTVLTGDSQITTARDVSKSRQTTVTADGQITARAEFAEAFADERSDNLTWDFSYDPFGFVSEWITETEELTETEAFTIVVDSVVSDFYEVGVEYDLDGDGEAEHRTDTQTVTSDGQTLVFPTVGEPGQYRIYIQQMRPDDFLRELTVGLTRY